MTINYQFKIFTKARYHPAIGLLSLGMETRSDTESPGRGTHPEDRAHLPPDSDCKCSPPRPHSLHWYIRPEWQTEVYDKIILPSEA